MRHDLPKPRKLTALVAAAAIAASIAIAACGDDDGESTAAETTSTSAASQAPDLSALPLGDGKVTTAAPKLGYVYACMEGGEGGGAMVDGPWIDQQAGTYNLEAKVVVPGEVKATGEFEVKLDGGSRIVTGNDLPDHTTGTFPIPADSEAYEYDANPNSISSQQVAMELPALPEELGEPSCMGGEVGVLLTGAAVFNGLDATNRDAVAHEVQDDCQGHPQISGIYHYHSQSECIDDNEPGQGHSPLVGYALDGFGIYGHHGEDGEVLTNNDLYECHGHRHEIDWDGETIELYHYHATYEYPYTASCFRGEPTQLQVIPNEMPTGAGGADPEDAQGPPEGAPAPPSQ
jgi:hypothetical protein